MITELYIGKDRLDLFKDDSIVIKNSVSKIEDITKVFTDTSNTFSVPATDNNNRIFKHYYNASINNSFDARKLVGGVIYVGGLHYKSGNFKLNKVILKSQKAFSYSLDFFGLLTQLKDVLKNDKLSSLDMSAYNFPYTYSNVYNNLASNQPLKNVVNTLISSRRYIYNSNTNANNTAIAKNLAFNNNTALNGLEWLDTNSSILNIRVLEAIEAKYNLTFSRDFFGTQAFTNLYLLLNGGNPLNELQEQVDITATTNDPTAFNNTLLYNVPTPSNEAIRVRVFTGGNDVDYDLIIKSGNEVIVEYKNISTDIDETYRSYNFSTFNNLTFYVRTRLSFSYQLKVERITSISGILIIYTSTSTSKEIEGTYDVKSKMPDIKIIDYLKGLFQAFKLIVIPTSANSLYVTTLNDYYRSGKVVDVTEFIDFKENQLSSGKLLKEIGYKFKESQTVLGEQFRTNNNNVDYGSLELDITDSNGELINGGTVNYELPFENMVYERLQDLSNSDNVNMVYGLTANSSIDPVTIKPHLHYVNNIALDSDIKIIGDFLSVNRLSTLNNVSHTLGYTSPQFSTVFGEEFDEYIGVKIQNTLYSNYHKDYIQLIFNEKKRSYVFKAKNVSLNLVKNLKLNDAIVIKGKNYRIDSFDVNLITREISFNLINSLNQSLTPIELLTVAKTGYYCSSDLPIGTITVAKDYNETQQ